MCSMAIYCTIKHSLQQTYILYSPGWKTVSGSLLSWYHKQGLILDQNVSWHLLIQRSVSTTMHNTMTQWYDLKWVLSSTANDRCVVESRPLWQRLCHCPSRSHKIISWVKVKCLVLSSLFVDQSLLTDSLIPFDWLKRTVAPKCGVAADTHKTLKKIAMLLGISWTHIWDFSW